MNVVHGGDLSPPHSAWYHIDPLLLPPLFAALATRNPSNIGDHKVGDEWYPAGYNAVGDKDGDDQIFALQERFEAIASPETVAKYGGPGVYPLPHGPKADNGNYLEPDEVAVRHGICGDPRVVSY